MEDSLALGTTSAASREASRSVAAAAARSREPRARDLEAPPAVDGLDAAERDEGSAPVEALESERPIQLPTLSRERTLFPSRSGSLALGTASAASHDPSRSVAAEAVQIFGIAAAARFRADDLPAPSAVDGPGAAEQDDEGAAPVEGRPSELPTLLREQKRLAARSEAGSASTLFPSASDLQKRGSSATQSSQCSLAMQSVASEAMCDISRVRACSAWDVMSGFGEVLTDNAVLSSEVYCNVSKPVKSLDFFLSHSWRQPRRRKFAELCLLYNLWPATVMALLGSWIGFLLHKLEVIPVLTTVNGETTGYASWLIGSVVFLLTFFCWGEVMRLRPRRFERPMVFLDKYCINQEDHEEKTHGIRCLGSTIARSKHLVVLHSEHYFKRLWTVYEIACFMATHDDLNSLTLIPETMPKLVLTGFLSSCTSDAIVRFSRGVFDLIGASGTVLYAVSLTTSLFCGLSLLLFLCRSWLADVHAVDRDLRRFRIQDAQCAEESDRPLVYQHVADLERSLGCVGGSASEDAALESFNARVREQLAPTFNEKLSTRFPYSYIVCASLTMLLRTPDQVLEACPREIALTVSMDICLACLLLPVVFWTLLWLARFKLHLRESLGWELLWCALLVTGVVFESFVLIFATRIVNTMALDSDAAMVTLGVLFFLEVLLTRWVFRNPSGRRDSLADAAHGRTDTRAP